MSKDNIISLCNHIRHRQNEHVADDIFRFHAYYNGKGEMVAAEYGREVNVEIAAERARKQKASRKAAKKKSNKDPPIPQLPLPRPNTVSSSQNSSQNEPRGNLLAIDPNSTSSNDNQNGPTTKPQHSRKTVAINGSSQVVTRSKSIHKGKRRK